MGPLTTDSLTIYKVIDTCPDCHDKLPPLIPQFANALGIPNDGIKDHIDDLDKYTELEHTQFIINGLNILKMNSNLFQQYILSQNNRVLYSALTILLIYRGMKN
jgi:hypothetical protein